MGNRRHSRSRRRRRAPHSKNITLITLVLLLVCVTAIPALAWLTAKSVVKNEFQIGKGDVVINEDIKKEKDTKQDVKFTNTGNVPIYIRANVSIYWKDADGNMMATVPQPGPDYDITWNLTNSGWVQGADGCYYYTSPVKENESTPNLIDSVTDIKKRNNYSDGRTFYVDIAAQSIQADPATAVTEAWGTSNGGSVKGVGNDGVLTIQETAEGGGA